MRNLTLLLLLLFPVSAGATLIIDQQQPAFDLAYPLLEIGGPLDKRLAQTFTVGIEGVMREVHLPVQCESGVLIVEIFEVEDDLPAPPSLGLLDRGLLEASSLPPVEPLEFRAIPLDELPPPPGTRFPIGSPSFFSRVGRRLAMVISNPTGLCTIARGIAVDPYTRGDGFFDERTMPRGWQPLDGNIEPSDDLPFKTVMDGDPPTTPCAVFGLTPNPIIPDFLPICRCLADESLREQRCTLLHPSFFLIRRIPFPIISGESFRVSWTLIPMTELGGDVELKEVLPKELEATIKKPLVFRAAHMKPGASATLDYKAVALTGKGGTFEVDTVITSPGIGQKPDVQQMRSLIDIDQK